MVQLPVNENRSPVRPDAPNAAVRTRVMVLVDEFPKTPETFIVDHVAGLARSGFDVVVVARKADKTRFRTLVGDIADSVTLDVLPGSQRKSLIDKYREIAWLKRWPRLVANKGARKLAARATGLRELIAAIEPDVVHAHFGPMGVSAALALGDGITPLLVDFHGYDTMRFPREHGWNLYRRVFGRPRCVRAIVHSPFTRSILERQIDLELAYVNYGVDTSLFLPGNKGAVWPSCVRLLSVGRLVGAKGHDVAIEALAALTAGTPDITFELTIVGDGEARAQLESLVRAHGLEPRVRFAGALVPSAVAREMQRADILVMASQIDPDGWQEAFGRVAIEGMATGLPIAATDSGGLPFAVGEAGVIADGYDGAALTDAIQKIMATGAPSYWRDIALERAHRFSIAQMDDDYARVTDEAVRSVTQR